MKHNYFILAAVAFVLSLAFAGCKKNTPETLTPKITDDKVEVTATTATFTWTVDWPGKLISVVEVSENEDMSHSQCYGFEEETDKTEFSVTINDLKPNSNYYYRYLVWNRYFVDNKFVMATKLFSTCEELKVVISKITVNSTSVMVVCNVISDGGVTMMERGVCWNTSYNSTVNDSHASSGTGTGSYTVNMTGLTTGTKYYVRAYVINSHGTSYGNEVSFTTNGSVGGHAYVDLGLPSGTLWATCNIGASRPEDYGNYYTWGETQTKDTYNLSNYQYCMGSSNTITKYCSNSSYGYNGFTDNLTTLLPEDDAATVKWGSDWRMPTREEWEELLNNTYHPGATQNGVYGRLFTGTNGNSIFLPTAGDRDSEFYSSGSYGHYWSRSLYTDMPIEAYYLIFDYRGYLCKMVDGARYCGFTVRPVRQN
ncbi:MAG: fibrobacter succinogenes major paralogous domain-containing protein [Bacteroidales bacterium]|nr:fibrobacter succinogenes major paralogous domain-containing protein [Bacteroidales bacterium]